MKRLASKMNFSFKHDSQEMPAGDEVAGGKKRTILSTSAPSPLQATVGKT